MAEDSTAWGERDLSPAHPIRFNYRRLVGGTRLLLRESKPWKLFRQEQIREYKDDLVATVGEWDGVEPGPHRFGGTEFLLDGREVGHIHNFGLLDVPLTRPLGEAVVAAGAASNHHVLPKGGWVSTFVDEPADKSHAAALFRLSYCWHVGKYPTERFGRTHTDLIDEVASLPLDSSIADSFADALMARTE
jgi:hypothetical protein